MLNLIEDYPDVIFVQDEATGHVAVACQSWFSWVNASETYDKYGLRLEFEPYGDYQVLAYNYWDGNNFQTITIDAEWETRYRQITDKEQIEQLTALLENAHFLFQKAGAKYYKSAVDESLIISDSRWPEEWPLFKIFDVEDLD